MSYTALEICAIVGLALSVSLVFVVADLNEQIAEMRQVLDSLKSKADDVEREKRQAERNVADAIEMEHEFPGLAAMNLLPHQTPQANIESNQPAASAPPQTPPTTRPLGWRLGRFLARHTK